MKTNPLRVRHLVKGYKYDVVAGSKEALNKEIANPSTLIPGVELAGFYEYTDFTQGIILGEKEIVFIDRLNKNEQEHCFDMMTNKETPYIILADGVDCPKVLRGMAETKDFPILKSEKKAYDVALEVYSFNVAKLAPQILLHGTLVEIYGSGVLLKGPSGIGKSEIALELVKRGHRLIADDSVVAYRRNHHLYGKAPEHLKNLLEVRGLGIIDVYRIFGVTSVADNEEINYVVELTSLDVVNSTNRLIETFEYEEIDDLKCPLVKLPVTSGRNMAELVEVAVMILRDRTMGNNSTKDFMESFDRMTRGDDKND